MIFAFILHNQEPHGGMGPIVRLSLCPLLNHVDSVAAANSAFAALSETFTLQSVSAVASATRDVFQWLLVTNFDS
jgi:hypothetical protein